MDKKLESKYKHLFERVYCSQGNRLIFYNSFTVEIKDRSLLVISNRYFRTRVIYNFDTEGRKKSQGIDNVSGEFSFSYEFRKGDSSIPLIKLQSNINFLIYDLFLNIDSYNCTRVFQFMSFFLFTSFLFSLRLPLLDSKYKYPTFFILILYLLIVSL